MSFKILLPISGKMRGERVRKVLDAVCKFATTGEFILVHAMKTLPRFNGGKSAEELRKNVQEGSMQMIINPILAMIEKRGMSHKVVFKEGSPVESILRVAREEQCDMIAMFTDGHKGLSNMMLGSITERVMRNTDIPLLAVRK